MQRSSWGSLWAQRFLGILALALLPQGSLERVAIRTHNLKNVLVEGQNASVSGVKCNDPVVEHGVKLSGFKQQYTLGNKITFECKIGYFIIGNYLIQCMGDSSWHPEVPSCKKISSTLCGAPVIPSGKVEPVLHYYGIGKFIDVYCNANYTFPDETIEMRLQCQGYNLWSPSVQPCFRRTSRDTSQLRIHNGRIISRKKNNFEPGDTVTIICNAGYALSGPAEIRYIGGKKWLPAVPACSLNDFFILLISALLLIVVLPVVKMIYQKYRSM